MAILSSSPVIDFIQCMDIVVGAKLIAPVVAVVNIVEKSTPNDGRDKSGPCDACFPIIE